MGRPSSDELCLRLAAEQFGLIHLRQALAAGLTQSQVKTRAVRGIWERCLPQVYRIKGSPSSWDQKAMGACLWAGDGSALFGPAAARRWGVNGFDHAAVEVATVSPKRGHGTRFKVHRCDRHLLGEIAHVGPMPVTSRRKTVVDLAGCKHARAERMLDQFIREADAFLGQMWLFYEQEWIRGRRGVAIVRGWLLERTPDLAPTDSTMEDLLWSLLVASDLSLPERQVSSRLAGGPVRWDFAYSDRLMAIECDGYAFHMDREAFERDRRRDMEARLLGWIVLRFTWAQIRYQPTFVIDMIRQHLSMRPSLSPSGR